MDTAAFSLYALVATALAVQLFLLAFYTGAVRARSGRFVNPEDQLINKGQASDEDHPDVLRVKRAHQNAIENAVPFFVIGALYVGTGASQLGAEVYFFTFLAARLLHSVFYLAGKQPFRSLMFAVSALATLGMAVHVVRFAFTML